jgi:homogentisate 1,2-dioxygenase
MQRWIHYPRRAGDASSQAHADLPAAGPYEREVGREGFFGPATHLHHRHPPTAWSDWEGPLRPRAYDLGRLDAGGDGPWAAQELLGNAHCRLRLWSCTAPMRQLFRNGDGDDLVFVHEGEGELFCDYGHLGYRSGDYLLIPRSTMWRIEPSAPSRFLLIEAVNGGYRLPERGLVGAHALFDPAVLAVPEIDDAFLAQQGEQPWQVVIRRRGALSTVSYPFNPLDVVGWHGDVAVCRLAWRDIRPLGSHRYHLPPSAHTTFVADRFVVCTFVPRPLETDPGALQLPFFHNNDDFDELIFYHAGSFVSRDMIHPGMMTLHPCGFTHGPHPGALRAAGRRRETDEVAVMIDARDALEPAAALGEVEWSGYVDSWKEARP